MSRRLEDRIRQLEAQVIALTRARQNDNVRLAAPMAPRLGRHLATLQEALTALGTATANIMVWSRDELTDTEIEVEVQEIQGNSYAAETQVWIVWDKTCWTVLTTSAAAQLGIPFINLSGQTIPPGGIMDWFGDTIVDGDLHVNCYAPGLLIRRRWLVNGPTAVPYQGTSRGSWFGDLSGYGAIDPGSTSQLSPHGGWGPRPGSFYLYPGMFGFDAVGSTVLLDSGTWLAHFRQTDTKHLKVLLTEDLERNSFSLARVLYRNHMSVAALSPFSAEIVLRDGFYLRTGEVIEASPSSPIVADIEWMGTYWEVTNAQCAIADIGTPDGGSQNTPAFEADHAGIQFAVDGSFIAQGPDFQPQS